MLFHIYHSNLIENIDDVNEDAQSVIAWKYLIKQKKLTHAVICEVQRLITKNQGDLTTSEKGAYRTIPVWVGDRACPSGHLVQGLMGNWLLDYKKLGTKKAHIRFEHIHPFVDGNGRTGRMLMWWHEVQLGKPATLITVENRGAYYKWFKEKTKS